MRKKILTTLAGALVLTTCLTITGCSGITVSIGDKETTQENEQDNEKEKEQDAEKVQNDNDTEQDTIEEGVELSEDEMAASGANEDTTADNESVGDDDVEQDEIPEGCQEYSVGTITVAYTGKSEVNMVVGNTNETMAVYGEDTTTCGISCFDSTTNQKYADFCERIVALNHKHKDVNGNIYYTADNEDGKASYIAFEDGTFVLFTYEDTEIFDKIMVYKK